MILCCTLFFSNQIIIGQQFDVKGKVLNENGNPIAFATAVLFEHDSIPVSSTYTDSLGNFTLKQKSGSYRLDIAWLNSKTITTEIVLFQDLDIGDFVLNENTNLEEISIMVRKKTFERKTDRIIFNVSQSVATNGSSALEALALTPLVSISGQGEIAIVGKNKVWDID